MTTASWDMFAPEDPNANSQSRGGVNTSQARFTFFSGSFIQMADDPCETENMHPPVNNPRFQKGHISYLSMDSASEDYMSHSSTNFSETESVQSLLLPTT